MKNIAAALVNAQKAFTPALKDKTNPAFRSKYADLGACIEAVQDALNSNGIALLQQTREDATGVTVETIFLHSSGESWASGPLHVPAAKQDPQGYGSALTYARRYSLMAACGIAPEDDDGNAASKAKQPEPRKVAGIPDDVRANPKKEAFDALAPDWKTYIIDMAAVIENLFEQSGAQAAAQEIADAAERDEWLNEHRIALEYKLSSKARTAISAVTKVAGVAA